MFSLYIIILETSCEDEADNYINSLVVYNGELTPFYQKIYEMENSVYDPIDKKWVIL